jgi:uncharacterized repeat protein (TIGR01451 family)
MKRVLPLAVLLLFVMAAHAYSQQEDTVPQYLEFDDRILVLKEYLKQDQIELVPSYRVLPNEWYANVYLEHPPEYFPLAPSGDVMQRPSETFKGREIFLDPTNLYLIVLYDFEHDLIIEAGEWKDINGDFVVQDEEWFDENGNGAREYGEWTDEGADGIPGTNDAGEANGVVDLLELTDMNGNGVFDIGEWHEGKNTDLIPTNNLPGEFNGAVDPSEWIGMNRDRSITKKLALKIYKKIYDGPSTYYKEMDYEEYISPSIPEKVFQHPALRAMTSLQDNQKLVLLLSLEECERCEIVGDVAWFEDEFARIVFNFQGFFKETLHTTLPRCAGCFEAEISHYANLEIYVHRKFDLLYENFCLHTMEPRGLPDNRGGTTAYYYTPEDEMTRIDRVERRIRQLVSFDPYYLVIKDNNELVLYETEYGKALIVPYEAKEAEYGSHIYKRKYSDGTEKDIRIELAHVYQIETIDCEQILVARLLIDEDTQILNTTSVDEDEKIFTVFYYACSDHFENNVIFPEEYEKGLSDFAIIVEKIELENEKVWLKFVRQVDSERIPNPGVFPYGIRDFQVVFDELDRDRPLGMCDYYPKEEQYVPRFEKILVDISVPFRDLLNNVVLKYEDLKGDPAEQAAYEEQPWEMAEWNTEITLIQVKKVAYNPNAADWSGQGYEGFPPFSAYIPPLDPAPGLVPVGPDLLPNFQISDEDFSGTCVPGDTITFYLEVHNGSGAPMPVVITDDIPVGMWNAAVAPPGTIIDTTGDTIIGNGGDTVSWSFPNLPPGYTLLSYTADVASDGSINFGASIINDAATAYYYEAGIPRAATAPTVIIQVQAAQLIKEAFQDLACTIPAPSILPGSRLYYRLRVYQTENIASTNPLSPFTALITEISDVIPPHTTSPQYHVAPPGLLPQPIVSDTMLWQGSSPLNSGNLINAVYSVFVPVGSVGRIVNNAQLTYDVSFPFPTLTTVVATSNTAETWIQVTPGQIIEPLEPCLYMTIGKEGPAAQGAGTIHYKITVVNRGFGPYADAFNIVVIDKIPKYVSAPFNITSTNPFVIINTFDSDGDGTIDTIMWTLDQLVAGDSFQLGFDVTIEIEEVPYNCYRLKVFTYDLYRPEQDRFLGMGGIARVGEYKITPEDVTEVIKDAVFTQIMKGAERLENYLIKIFESKIYDKKFYFQFSEFSEKDRSARFELFSSVAPAMDLNIYWGILEQTAMETGSPQIYSGDLFLAHVLLRNDGDGTASEISYELDAPDFNPTDMTWVYDLEKHLKLEIGPGEQAGLLFLMNAPSVSHETTFPVKVKITYSDGLDVQTETKTVYMNVLSERRASVSLKKTIVEGKSVVKETGKEVADMRVGEERTITAYIKNLSEDTIKQVHYIDQIPPGLEVVEGHAEWMGTLEPGESVKVTYKIKVKQIGVYQFRGKTFYKDERDHVYEGVSNVTEIRVVTDPGPKLNREIDSTIIAKGDTVTVVIRVENDTPNVLEHIQVVDIIPEGFTVEQLETKGLEEDDGTVRYYIDELNPDKYILLKYTLKSGEKAGKFNYKGVRLAYENADGLKQEILTEDQSLLIPETETPNVKLEHELKRKVDADGEYITVILTIPNTGGISAKNIKIRTLLLEGTEFVEASTNYLQEGDTLTFSVDEIAAGEEVVMKYTFKVPHFNQDRTYGLKFDTVYSDDFEREYSVEMEDEFDVKAQKPSLKVTKVVDKNAVKLNFSVRVAINVINEGEIPATTHVVDPLPDGMILLSGTNEWEGLLEPGESAQIIYEMLCTRVGTIAIPKATASYQDKWKISYTAESGQTVLNVRGILVEKSVDVGTLKVGEVVVITVVVTNTYDERATNVVIEDSIPEEFEVVEGDTSWNIAVLNPSEALTFMYSLKPETAGSFNLGAARATFIDVYNDRHESVSGSISISTEEMVPPEEEIPIPTKPPEEVVETLADRLAKSFDITLILVIFLIMAITMMLAFLLIERRRTEEELAVEELPPVPSEREVIWKKEEMEKLPLPTPEERAEAQELTTPLDILERRRERTEEAKEEIERVAESRDIHELLGKEEDKKFEEEPEVFELERELPREPREELDLEDIFAEEESEEQREQESGFTDVREILRMTRREEEKSPKKDNFEFPLWEGEEEKKEQKAEDLPDIRELIKGPKKPEEASREPVSKSDSEKEEELDEFNPRDFLKKQD